MSHLQTAAQRALSIPEILFHVFVEVHQPSNFSRVNKSWRGVALDPLNVSKHYERRYWPFEIVHGLLSEPGWHRGCDISAVLSVSSGKQGEQQLLMQDFPKRMLHRGAFLSQAFLVSFHPGLVDRGGKGCLKWYNTETGETLYIPYAICRQLSDYRRAQDLPSVDMAKLPLATRSAENQGREEIQLFYRLATKARESDLIQFLRRRGLPYWDMYELHWLLVGQIMDNDDPAWIIDILSREAGCPPVSNYETHEVEYIIDHLDDCLTDEGQDISSNAAKCLLETWPFQISSILCDRIWRRATEIASPDFDDFMASIFTAQGRQDWKRSTIVLLLEFCHPAQLSRSDEARERFVCLWLFADTQGESLSGHTHAGIDAKLLWLISLGYAAGTMKTLEEVISKYPKILTRTCAFHWLSNPFHTLDSFRKSLNFVEAYLAKYHRFDWLLSDLIDDLLGNATAGMHINHLLQRHDWVADTVSFRINAKTARGIVDGPEILEPGPADDLTRAARKVMLDAARDNEDCRVELVPVSGYASLALVLLVNLQESGSHALQVVYEEALRCDNLPIILAYEQAGFSTDDPTFVRHRLGTLAR